MNIVGWTPLFFWCVMFVGCTIIYYTEGAGGAPTAAELRKKEHHMEQAVLDWCSNNKSVAKCSFRSVHAQFVDYIHPSMPSHPYHPDFYIEFVDYRQPMLVDVQPRWKIKPNSPLKGGFWDEQRRQAERNAAQHLTGQNGWVYEVWNEEHLREYGVDL